MSVAEIPSPAAGARGCTGKIRYASRADAIRAMRDFIRRRGRKDKLDTYACGHCSGFHIGRNPKQRAAPNVFDDYAGKARRYWQLVRGEG